MALGRDEQLLGSIKDLPGINAEVLRNLVNTDFAAGGHAELQTNDGLKPIEHPSAKCH